jgi:hypothetical protein
MNRLIEAGDFGNSGNEVPITLNELKQMHEFEVIES